MRLALTCALRDHFYARTLFPRSLHDREHRFFAALEPVMTAPLIFQNEAHKIAEVIVDNSYDLAGYFLGFLSGMRLLCGHAWALTGLRGRNLWGRSEAR